MEHKCIYLYMTLIMLFAIFCLGLFVNVKIPKWCRKYAEQTYVAADLHPDTITEILRSGVMHLLVYDWTADSRIYYGHSFYRWMKTPNISVWGYGEYAYMLYYSLLYAIESKDVILYNSLKCRFDEGLESGAIEIKRVDQTPYGLVAILLYRETQENKYMLYAQDVYKHLQAFVEDDGIILYRQGGNEQYIDALGLVCPFLFLYGEEFGCDKSSQIASRMVEDFMDNGVDEKSGVPSKKYSRTLHCKTHCANWGRGVSWYLLALEHYSPQSEKYKLLCEKILSFISCIPVNMMTQYLGSGHVDTTTLVPFLWGRMTMNNTEISYADYCEYLSGLVSHNGVVYYASPTMGMPLEKPTCYEFSFLTQGLALYLCTKLN